MNNEEYIEFLELLKEKISKMSGENKEKLIAAYNQVLNKMRIGSNYPKNYGSIKGMINCINMIYDESSMFRLNCYDILSLISLEEILKEIRMEYYNNSCRYRHTYGNWRKSSTIFGWEQECVFCGKLLHTEFMPKEIFEEKKQYCMENGHKYGSLWETHLTMSGTKIDYFSKTCAHCTEKLISRTIPEEIEKCKHQNGKWKKRTNEEDVPYKVFECPDCGYESPHDYLSYTKVESYIGYPDVKFKRVRVDSRDDIHAGRDEVEISTDYSKPVVFTYRSNHQ